MVTEQEEEGIKKNMLMGYSADSPWFPSGLCLKCIHDISSAAKGAEVQFKLADDYLCVLERSTRSIACTLCDCRWCKLGRLGGLKFLHWQREMKGRKVKVVRLFQVC